MKKFFKDLDAWREEFHGVPAGADRREKEAAFLKLQKRIADETIRAHRAGVDFQALNIDDKLDMLKWLLQEGEGEE